MTDEPTPDDDVEQPDAHPAVPEPHQPHDGGTPQRGGRMVRTGCIVLGLMGLLGVYFGGSVAADPERAQCVQAKTILKDEDEIESNDDVTCDEAFARVDELNASDTQDDISEVSSESAIRTFYVAVAAIGVLQIAGALLTARTVTKGARLLALIAAALGLVLSPLGLLAVPLLAFVVYALLFSANARAIFGDPGGPRIFRPRT